jgi:dodecin
MTRLVAEDRVRLSNPGGQMAVASVTKTTAASPEGLNSAVCERPSSTLRSITGLHVIECKAIVANEMINELSGDDGRMQVTFVLEKLNIPGRFGKPHACGERLHQRGSGARCWGLISLLRTRWSDTRPGYTTSPGSKVRDARRPLTQAL